MAEFLQQCGSWGVLATLAAYAAGVWINRKTGKALFNPLLMGSIFVIVFLSCFGVPYADYKSSAQPVNWLLMPATVSLAIPLYEKWELLEKNLAAIFASIAAGVLTSLGSVLAMAWVTVGVTGNLSGVREITWRGWLFLALSGLATGASWLCYYRALQLGQVAKVVTVDKFSLVLTILLGALLLGEKLNVKTVLGALLVTAGTLVIAFA